MPSSRPTLLLALAGFLPALASAALAFAPWPLLRVPALLLAGSLAMSAAAYATGLAQPPWHSRTLHALPGHLARFALASLLLATLTLWPLAQLQREPGAASWTLLAGALVLALVGLTPFWIRFLEVFAGLSSGATDAEAMGARIAHRFSRADARGGLARTVPGTSALLLMAGGVVAFSGLPPLQWPSMLAFRLALAVFAVVLLPASAILLAACGRRPLAGDPSATEPPAAAAPTAVPAWQLPTTATAASDPAGEAPVVGQATVTAEAASGDTMLLDAARRGDVDAAVALLEAGGNADATPAREATDQRSPLALAAVLPDTRLLRQLIAHGASVNRLQGGFTALHAATRDSWHGRDEAVLALLANGADPRLRDAEGRTPLHGAALSGNPNIAAMLLDAGAHIDALDSQGLSALALACKAGNWTLAAFLLEHGASPNPEGGQPPLIAACSIGEDDIAGGRLLLKHRAKVDAQDRLGRTALLAAALEGHVALVRLLLAAGANPHRTDRNGTTALIEAARAGNPAVIEALGAAGADVAAVDVHGRDALILACQTPRSSADTIRALLALGADPARRGSDGRTALDHAVAAGRWDLVSALAPDAPLPANLRGPASPAAGADTPADLLEALRGEHWSTVSSFETRLAEWPAADRGDLYLQLASAGHDAARRWLLDHGIQGEERLQDGMRLFDALVVRLPATLEALADLLTVGASPAGGGWLARALAHLGGVPEGAALVDVLLQRGADGFGADESGRTPLMLAAAAGWQAALDTLLARGADANARDARAQAPLHYALQQPPAHALPLVRSLVRWGADPRATADNGETPLGLALATGHDSLVDWLRWDGGWPLPRRPLRAEDVAVAAASGDAAAVRRLLELGFAADQPDAGGHGGLVHACGRGHEEVATLLMDAGAQADAVGNDGISPLAAAVNGRQHKLVALLLARGARVDLPLAGGTRALMLAAARGSADLVDVLLDAGADVNAASDHGQSALLVAARQAFDHRDSLGARRVFDALLRRGADIRQSDQGGLDALLLLVGAHAPPGQDGDATHIGALLPRLLDAGADVTHADQRGVTALHACAMHALLGPARTLIQRGAPLAARDAWGRTPAQVAQKLGYSDLALELEARTAPGVRQTLVRPAEE